MCITLFEKEKIVKSNSNNIQYMEDSVWPCRFDAEMSLPTVITSEQKLVLRCILMNTY